MSHKATDKSVEQKLFEAFQDCSGVRLTAEDVDALINDLEIDKRISNRACDELGIGYVDAAAIAYGETWRQFQERLLKGDE